MEQKSLFSMGAEELAKINVGKNPPQLGDGQEEFQNLCMASAELVDQLRNLGCDIEDATVYRFASTLLEDLSHEPELRFKTYPYEGSEQLILMKDHECYTRCPHHLERVKLNITIGYVPHRKICGLSKLARVANYAAAKPVLQEELTNTIANLLEEYLAPHRLFVYVEGTHMCMKARGVRTSAVVRTLVVKGFQYQEVAPWIIS